MRHNSGPEGSAEKTVKDIRRETNSWKWVGFALAYLFGFAYFGAGAVYWTARALGL